MGNKKHQVDIWCGRQSYIYRTNSKKEVAKFIGLKKITAETISRFLQDLHLKIGQYEIPMAPTVRKPKEKSAPRMSYQDQLIAKLGIKGKKLSKSQINRIKALPEKRAQMELGELLRGGR